MIDRNFYKTKGTILFYCATTRKTSTKMLTMFKSLPSYIECSNQEGYEIGYSGDLYSGKDFLEMVMDGGITNYDGIVSHVFVNHCESNLGLFAIGFTCGGFLVDAVQWERLCKDYTVEVVWANK